MPLDPRLRTAWERFLALIPVFLVLADIGIWVLAGLTLGRLEGPIAIHFDAHGTPNDFIDASLWWVLPAIGTGLALVMLGVIALTRRLVRTRPQLVNVPLKHTFMALPEAARLRIMPRVAQLVLGFVLIVHFILLAVIRDTHRVATHDIPGLSVWKLVVLLALALLWVGIGTLRIRNQIRTEGLALAAAVTPPSA